MGLDNVAVQWPRTGRFYDPVAPAEFVDFGGLRRADPERARAGRRARRPGRPDRHGPGHRVHRTGRPAARPRRRALRHRRRGRGRGPGDRPGRLRLDRRRRWSGSSPATPSSARRSPSRPSTEVLRNAIAGGRLAEQQLRWLDDRLEQMRDEHGDLPSWSFSRTELIVLAQFYRRCADRGFAVYADF